MTADPRDPLGLRHDAPLLDGWLTATAAVAAGTFRPQSLPGHKHRTDLLGAVVVGDIPLFNGLGTLRGASGLLEQAEARAAAHWGGDWCRFSVGGSSHGNQALALAVASPGDTVVVSRTLHRSLLLGLVLAGLNPVWVHHDVDPATGLPGPLAPQTLAEALAEHPDAAAVFVVDPGYIGATGDLAALAALAHGAGVPLLVDNAWAAHFGSHPDLPQHPLALGADAMVTSAHKALLALNQGALVVARTRRSGGLLDPDRLDRAFDATLTTSPSGAILASIDACRALLAQHGPRLSKQLLEVVARARRRLRDGGLTVLEGPTVRPGFDPAKLVVDLAGTGVHGHDVEADLQRHGCPAEMADRDLLVAIVTYADGPDDVDHFVDVVLDSVRRHQDAGTRRGSPAASTAGGARSQDWSAVWSLRPTVALPPREAFFARHEVVTAERAVGRVCAELIAPYPPGIPVLAPGEVVTAEVLAALRGVRADGGRIAYAADPDLATIHVVA